MVSSAFVIPAVSKDLQHHRLKSQTRQSLQRVHRWLQTPTADLLLTVDPSLHQTGSSGLQSTFIPLPSLSTASRQPSFAETISAETPENSRRSAEGPDRLSALVSALCWIVFLFLSDAVHLLQTVFLDVTLLLPSFLRISNSSSVCAEILFHAVKLCFL